MNKTNNILFTGPQTSAEYARSEYVGAIDILNEAQKTTGSVRDIREAMIDHYRHSTPELMKGIDSISGELGRIASSIEDIAGTASDILREVELVNHNLENIAGVLVSGFELVVARLDEGNRLLSDIIDILSSPVATEATEYLNRAKDYLHDGFYEEAEEDFRKVTELDRGNYCAWYLIGLIRCQSAGDRDGAIDAFEKCNKYASVRSRYHYSRSLFQQALIYQRVDNAIEEAVAALKRSVEADTENYQSHFFIAELLASAGEIEEAAQHLALCVDGDAIYYLKSSSSKALVNSGVHDRYFAKKAASLHSTNKSLSKFLKSAINLSNELYAWSDEAIGLGAASENFVSLESSISENDYLAQRELRRIGSEVSRALQERISTNKQWLNRHIETVRSSVEGRVVAAKRETEEQVSKTQETVAIVSAICIGGGVIFFILLEVIRTFQQSILEGIFMIILLALFGGVFLAIAAACWAAFSGIIYGILAIFGKTKSDALQSKIRTEGEQEIASQQKSSRRFIKQLDQLKTALDPY